MFKQLSTSLYFLILISSNVLAAPHLTVVGEIDYWGSLTRTTIGAIDILYDKFPINFIRTPRNKMGINFKDMPYKVKKTVKASKKEYGKVILLCETLNNPSVWKELPKFPKSSLRVAVSVTEFSQISEKWVNAFNNYFDMIIVPDPFLIDIYKNSGIKIPIFFLPNGIYTRDFLAVKPRKYDSSRPFVFGVSSTFIPRKNNDLLVDAFIKAYGNNPKFKLAICGRYGQADLINKLKNKIKNKRINNIFLLQKRLSQKDYIRFISEIDCYVSFAKGEGFSMTPREAMLIEKPCILSNNTGHRTICDTGLVKAVKSDIKEPAKGGLGIYYNCRFADTVKALKSMHRNYDKYLNKAKKAKLWAMQYDYFNQTGLYMGFVMPEKVLLGDENIISKNYITTKSKTLYDKYLKILNR